MTRNVSATYSNGKYIILLGILVVITLILHELVYGMAIMKLGGKPRFGAGVSHFL